MLTVPHSLKDEHEDFHEELTRAVQLGGRIGPLAKQIADLFRRHFIREEEFVLPPLSALTDLAAGKPVTETLQIVSMTDRLRAELPAIISEHRAMIASLNELAEAAREDGHPEIVRIVERLKRHSSKQEEVLYPAAMLVGQYLKSFPGPHLTPARWPERTL